MFACRAEGGYSGLNRLTKITLPFDTVEFNVAGAVCCAKILALEPKAVPSSAIPNILLTNSDFTLENRAMPEPHPPNSAKLIMGVPTALQLASSWSRDERVSRDEVTQRPLGGFRDADAWCDQDLVGTVAVIGNEQI